MRRSRLVRRLVAATAIAGASALALTGTASAAPAAAPPAPGPLVYSQFQIPGLLNGCGILNVGSALGYAQNGGGDKAPNLRANQTQFGVLMDAPPFGAIRARHGDAQNTMQVYWFNLSTFQGGVAPLDDQGWQATDPLHILPKTNDLHKTVDTGQGIIVAGVLGSVQRDTTHSTCTIGTPTLGLIVTP